MDDRDRDRKYREMARRGKYQRLYTYLCRLRAAEWCGSGHSQALAWSAAGWETAEVDMVSETLLLRRQRMKTMPPRTLDAVWPVHRAGAWPQGLSLRRENIYEDRI